MLLVDEVDNKEFLTGLFDVMYDELPTPKPKKDVYKRQRYEERKITLSAEAVKRRTSAFSGLSANNLQEHG